MNRSSPLKKYVLFAAFALSGFSGLIYESVWTSYLKFFLGHAAYAQALVLAMFMGGMAGGAWLSSRYIVKTPNPLIAYAAIEILIGIFGIGFHSLFVSASGLLYGTLLPGVESPLMVELVRWGFAAALILVQTLLLGATFPLMSVGVLRAFPGTPGSSISILYFTNSIGAVVGVLVSGFFLIGEVGLPGTVLTAGVVNVLLALLVYAIGRSVTQTVSAETSGANGPRTLVVPMLVVATITGLSSFIYEISWIRMLSMITGASTHAFELMLSAFILGLALGGFWLRKRIDKFHNPLLALGVIQLLMGLFALATVLLYNPSLEIMANLFQGLRNTMSGYVVFNLSSYALSMALMLPTTFMAGMTLPLITLVLYKQGGGESAVGKVYAMNTLGAIAGIILAAMLLLPALGLKMAVIIGAALDLLLALFLFFRAGLGRMRQIGGWALVAASVLLAVNAAPFDSARMSSGIFRGTVAGDHRGKEILLHHDGRTATVDVARVGDKMMIATNGKSDASVSMKGQPTMDEPTMVLLGALPQMLNPELKTAAMIGMGAGMSADVLLMSDSLERLDLIEIEAGMVEGARLFKEHSARVFSDPRSHIHIDDAKSYFSSHKKRYDVIVSEPSDTWVSGISTLFTDEFYARMRHHLTDDGLLIQWVATYRSNPEIFASIMKALGKNFGDYRLYATTDKVVVIVAKVNGKIPQLNAKPLQIPALAKVLVRNGLPRVEDVITHELGGKAFLDPLFQANPAPVNSDYFPYVDQNAAKAHYLETTFADLTTLNAIGLPMPGLNFDGTVKATLGATGGRYSFHYEQQYGRALLSQFTSPSSAEGFSHPALFSIGAILRTKPGCEDVAAQRAWQKELLKLARLVIPATTKEEAAPMIAYLKGQLCSSTQARENRDLLDIMAAVSARDMAATEVAARKLVTTNNRGIGTASGYAYNALLLAYYQQKKWVEINKLQLRSTGPHSVFSDIVSAHAAQ